jgi:peroxiredoxin Q/BCP
MKRFVSFTACLLSIMGMSGGEASAADLKVGDKVPAFEVKDDTGKVWKSNNVIGKKMLVVFFYPADLTGG